MNSIAKTNIFNTLSIVILWFITRDKSDTYQFQCIALLILMLILDQLVYIRHKNK